MTSVTANVTQTTKQVAKIRQPAKVLMAKRTRFTFGHAYIAGVLSETHRDHAKMLVHAVTMKLGKKTDLAKLKLETLRKKLADAILKAPDGSMPPSVKIKS